jgi:hypothetical protein
VPQLKHPEGGPALLEFPGTFWFKTLALKLGLTALESDACLAGIQMFLLTCSAWEEKALSIRLQIVSPSFSFLSHVNILFGLQKLTDMLMTYY